MKHTLVCLGIFSLALVPANARRFAEGPVKLAIWPAKAPESPDKLRLLPKTEDLTDANAVPLYEKAVQVMPRGIKQDQIREWLKLPPESGVFAGPQQQVEEMVQKYMESLKLVVQATKCRQCNWPDWKPGAEIPNLTEYRELAFVIQLWARLEISRGGHQGALLAMQAGFAMAKQLGEAPTIMQSLVGVAVAAMMCREVEYFMQAKDAPNLHAALSALPKPFIDVEKAIENEKGNLKDYNVLARRQLEKIVDPAHERTRLISKRLANNLNGLQCVEAIRYYAATHDGQLPQTFGDITDVAVPNDLMSDKAFQYRRTADGVELQSAIPEGGGPEDTIHYAIVVKK